MRKCWFLLLLAFTGCLVHAPKPKQNERWSIPPEKYGSESLQGLASPGYVDAGAD